MELRDVFAAIALHAIFDHPDEFLTDEFAHYARTAYLIADQMMAERAKPTSHEQPIYGSGIPTRPA